MWNVVRQLLIEYLSVLNDDVRHGFAHFETGCLLQRKIDVVPEPQRGNTTIGCDADGV